MARSSQSFDLTPGGGTWVPLTGWSPEARWVSIGQTGATDYRLTRTDGVAVAAWSEPAGERPRELYVPTDLRVEASQPGGAPAERVFIQEGVSWPGR